MSPSAIEWTDETWNPTVGCSKISPGCDHCYAIGVAARGMQAAPRGLTNNEEHFNDRSIPLDWTGEVRCLPERLHRPYKVPGAKRIFTGSMSDLFHPDVPGEFLAQVFAVMSKCPQHTFQVLTKRPQRMAKVLADRSFVVAVDEHRTAAAGDFVWPLPNVHAMTSVESQKWADLRVPHVLATPAVVRGLSIEPLLGPVDVRWALGENAGGPGIDWVIVGGESGPGARPMRPGWVRSIRDQCQAAGVAFFFKQWGNWRPLLGNECATGADRVLDDGTCVRPMAKHDAGAELDGRTWKQFPS